MTVADETKENQSGEPPAGKSVDAEEEADPAREEDKYLRIERLRSVLLGETDVEILEIEIDEEEYENESEGSFRAGPHGKFYLPKIPPFKGSGNAGAAEEEVYEEEIVEEIVEEEVVEEEIVEEVVDEEYSIEDIDEETDDLVIPEEKPADLSAVKEDDDAKTEKTEGAETGDEDEGDGGDDDDDDDEDKPSLEEVKEAISYILMQEKPVDNGFIGPEHAQAILNLPLDNMMDIMNHFETCDNNGAPIRWDLVLLMLNSFDEYAGDDGDDDDDDEG